MKLAEALMLRADAQKKAEQLKQRLVRNAKVQEDDPPAEDPSALLIEFEHVTAALTSLIQRINRTNSHTTLDGGQTLTDALAERDVLKIKHATYQALAEAATVTQDRYSRSEVKFQSTVKVAAMQAKADAIAKAHRELDARIQACNWNTELLEDGGG